MALRELEKCGHLNLSPDLGLESSWSKPTRGDWNNFPERKFLTLSQYPAPGSELSDSHAYYSVFLQRLLSEQKLDFYQKRPRHFTY